MQTSSFCGERVGLVEAKRDDMIIICGENNIDVKPEAFSAENEIVLKIKRIIIHPDYIASGRDNRTLDAGPIDGSDIAVYHVDDSPLYKDGVSILKPKELFPACLPKQEYSSNKGIFAGWLDPEPYYRVSPTENLGTYRRTYLQTKQVLVEEVLCRDPPWMRSNTFYPAGTECYRDPSQTSCFLFGNSGSGVLRQFPSADGKQRFSWTGLLTLSKGCDLSFISRGEITYAAENSGVFTSGICYLDWIANQYGLRMPDDFSKPESCSKSKGDKFDFMKSSCAASGGTTNVSDNAPVELFSRFTTCDFTQKDDDGKPWDRCRLLAQEGYAYNIYHCKDPTGQIVVCANNCRGVDPNSVVVGGTALLAATTTSAVGVLAPAIPIGLGTLALGGMMMMTNRAQCPPRTCRVCFKDFNHSYHL